jgi:large subunit ribosomal protein L35
MPKMKTHKGTRKRFRLTANGKVKHRGAGTSHLATAMSPRRKRNLRGTRVLNHGMVKNITIALNHNSL